MISTKCIFKYREQYPDDSCFFGEPGFGVIIESAVSNKAFISPFDETNETFLDRLNRSQKNGHNYFYDEWKPFEYDPDLLY